MTDVILGGVAVVSLGFNARSLGQWMKGWPDERRELKQQMLAAVPGDFADRVLREHPDWREGIVPMARVRLVLRLYALAE